MEKIPTFQLVVAGALAGESGRWLMHRRPPEKHHGGLWEFPGGKVDAGETPVFALIRELREELAVEIDREAARPAGFAEEPQDARSTPIVILLYKVTAWTGIPVCTEGGAVDWFTPEEIARLDMPPLDRDLAARLFEKTFR